MKYDRGIIWVDIESTGVDPENDRIVEIALIKDEAMGQKELSTRINPGIPIPESSSKIHGILDSDVADKPKFCDIAEKTFKFIQGYDLAGFNSNKFDIPLLYNEFARCGFTLDYRNINLFDVGNLFKIMEPRTLTAGVSFYLNRTHDDAHGALADIKATQEIFHHMVKKYGDLLPESATEMSLMMNHDKPILDLSGKFSVDDDGDYIYNFGKERGNKVKDNMNYLDWMLNRATFSQDTTDIGREIYEQIKQKNKL